MVISETNLSSVCPGRETSGSSKAQGCCATEGTPCLVLQGPASSTSTPAGTQVWLLPLGLGWDLVTQVLER